jgi:hypothetical protein
MKILSKLISIPVLIVVAWLGSNIYNGNELFANPFEEQTVLEDMKKSGSDFLDEKVEDATDAAKDSFNQGVDDAGDALKYMTE